MFSILIPTWNNLEFVKLCVEGIRKNSSFTHQIILHINDGSDGTLFWAQQNDVEYTHTAENVGVCTAVNMASQKVIHDYVVFMNDDMYPLPDWDKQLTNEITKAGSDLFMFSSTMIEPYDTGNRCVVVADYGRDAISFREKELLNNFNSLKRSNWSGATWPPSVVHRKWWEKVGGYSEEFSPGMSSDDDFAMKMWQAGCRIYKGVGNSLVYHFISKSTGRVVRNDGRRQFMRKWGIKQSTFHKYYTKRGEPYTGLLKDPRLTARLLLQKLIARLGM